jgi:hypothetical protein
MVAVTMPEREVLNLAFGDIRARSAPEVGHAPGSVALDDRLRHGGICCAAGWRDCAVQTVAAFAARLKDAVDLDTVREDLARVIEAALEPAHVSMWTSLGE